MKVNEKIFSHRSQRRRQIEHFEYRSHMYDDNKLLFVLIYFSQQIGLEYIQQLDHIHSVLYIHENKWLTVNDEFFLRINLFYSKTK